MLSCFVDFLEEYKILMVRNCKNVFLWICNVKCYLGNNVVKEYDMFEY